MGRPKADEPRSEVEVGMTLYPDPLRGCIRVFHQRKNNYRKAGVNWDSEVEMMNGEEIAYFPTIRQGRLKEFGQKRTLTHQPHRKWATTFYRRANDISKRT